MQCRDQQVTTDVKLLPTIQCQLGLVNINLTKILRQNVLQDAWPLLSRLRVFLEPLQLLKKPSQSCLSACRLLLYFPRRMPILHSQIITYIAFKSNHLLQLIMASSPFISNDVKTYMRKFQIQSLINRTINDLLKGRPEDPYAFIIAQMQKMATPPIELVSVQASETTSGQGTTFLKIRATVRYLQKELSLWLPQPFSILSDENMLYDEDRLAGKGLLKTALFIQNKLSPAISKLKCQQQQEIDKELQKAYTQNESKGIYAVNSLSFLPTLVRSQLVSRPPYQLVAQLADNKGPKSLKCMVGCLQGGKVIGSKCKVTKFYILARQVKDPLVLQTALQAVRKNIVSGKGGEAALKLSPDGTFVCPLDTIADNLKIVEDAINSVGAGKQTLAIGLSWAADTLFAPDTKKYQLQNPKTPFDNDQMIDYLVKLVQDKPIIQYLEDPLASTQSAAWRKLITSLKENEVTKNVLVGARHGKLINLADKNIKNKIADLSVPQTADSHPDSTEEQRQQANATKFQLNLFGVRAFQLLTLSNILRDWRQLKKVKSELVLQDCAFESYDTSLVDLCYGLNCWLCLGSITKFDRISKLNRMREIIYETKPNE